MKNIYFIIPVYKVEAYLERCINSCLNQTYKNVKIILVDDGSPDKCPEICDKYALQYENIKVIHKINGGLSDARNAGILYVLEVAQPDDYITFVDSDDFVHPDFAKIMIDLCEKHNCGVAQCDYEKGYCDNFSTNSIKADTFIVGSLKALLGNKIKSMAWAKMYKAEVFADTLFPVGVINEDEFFTYKAVFYGKNVAFTNKKLYYYFQHNDSIMVDVAKKMKNNPHRYDFLKAYNERIMFFEQRNLPEQVLKTKEKICTDIILRFCEQMYLKKSDRDIDCIEGKYLKIYRENYKEMIKRKGMPLKRKLMYISFNVFPYIAVITSKIFGLRK